MTIYFNKIKTLSRHTAAQSHHNEHHSNQQLYTVPRVTRGIIVERGPFASDVASSRFIEKNHVKSKSRTSRPTVLTFRHRVLQIHTALYAKGAQILYEGAQNLWAISTELAAGHPNVMSYK